MADTFAASPALDPTAPRQRLRPVSAVRLAEEHEPDVRWVWEGYLARGEVTLLTSQWKVGKTTLLAALLDRMAAGGALAGQPVPAARAVVLSEEGPQHWARRCRQFSAWPHVGFFCRPLRGLPTPQQWRELIDDLRQLGQEEQIDLFVVDALSAFLPRGTESVASALIEVLRPLESLTAQGAAVLLLHHPKKGDALAGQAARGSGALCSYVDVLMEMHWAMRDRREDRRRRLCAWSRHVETPLEQVIELSADGRDYAVVEAPVDEDVRERHDVLHLLLADATEQLTRKQILHNWPERRPPSAITLHRLLQQAVELGHITQHGTGLKNDPFRYTLPNHDLPYWPDPFETLDLSPASILSFDSDDSESGSEEEDIAE